MFMFQVLSILVKEGCFNFSISPLVTIFRRTFTKNPFSPVVSGTEYLRDRWKKSNEWLKTNIMIKFPSWHIFLVFLPTTLLTTFIRWLISPFYLFTSERIGGFLTEQNLIMFSTFSQSSKTSRKLLPSKSL
jgi:hypothetical protein